MEECIGEEGIPDPAICRNKEIVAEAREVRDMLTAMVDRMTGIDIPEHREAGTEKDREDPGNE